MAHTLRIMPESEQTRATLQAERGHQAALEEATTQIIGTLPRMFRSIKHHQRSLELDAAHKELGEQQMWALHTLTRGRQLTSELAKIFNVSNPTITRTIDALVEKGYVERLQDPHDRRKIYLQLTPSGMEIGESAHAQFRTAMSDFLSPLTGSQLYDIATACRHISVLLPESVYEYESACPVKRSVMQDEEA